MQDASNSMAAKICMVTGANSGIGKATALALAQMGATVVMVCRDRARGEEARSEITTKSRNNAVDLLLADLSSQQSIRQLVENFQHHYGTVAIPAVLQPYMGGQEGIEPHG